MLTLSRCSGLSCTLPAGVGEGFRAPRRCAEINKRARGGRGGAREKASKELQQMLSITWKTLIKLLDF